MKKLKYPLHGKQAQLRVFSDGKAENENDIVEKEYNTKENKKNPFKKIYEAVKKQK